MAAIGHFENKLFNGLAYSTMSNMVLGDLGVKELVFDVILMSWPRFDLQIQDGCRQQPTREQQILLQINSFIFTELL